MENNQKYKKQKGSEERLAESFRVKVKDRFKVKDKDRFRVKDKKVLGEGQSMFIVNQRFRSRG